MIKIHVATRAKGIKKTVASLQKKRCHGLKPKKERVKPSAASLITVEQNQHDDSETKQVRHVQNSKASLHHS